MEGRRNAGCRSLPYDPNGRGAEPHLLSHCGQPIYALIPTQTPFPFHSSRPSGEGASGAVAERVGRRRAAVGRLPLGHTRSQHIRRSGRQFGRQRQRTRCRRRLRRTRRRRKHLWRWKRRWERGVRRRQHARGRWMRGKLPTRRRRFHLSSHRRNLCTHGRVRKRNRRNR